MSAALDRRSPAVPNAGEWRHLHCAVLCQAVTRGIGAETHVYEDTGLRVLSSREEVEYRGVIVPHNHVSVSVDADRRATDAEIARVRAAFDMQDAEEDNHQAGCTRNLFLPLHLPRGTTGLCDCKSDETQVVEPDGFVWSKPRELS